MIVVDSYLPRNYWPRGEVTAVFPGAGDGIVRSVELRTLGGHLRRPARKLAVIVEAERRAEVASHLGGNKELRRLRRGESC